MNEQQSRIKQYMDSQIYDLKEGMHCLQDREKQPNTLGDLYNGMLKHTVSFEIGHMEKLRDELVDLLK